jgi:formate-dependent nitrite reductase cytochrome c552 subunit
MDFDHRDGTTKAFRLTSGGAALRPTAALLAEVAKCDIVCANCHRIRTQARHAAAGSADAGRDEGSNAKRRRWRHHGQLLDDLRGVPCADCGDRFPPCAMDFDHRDPRTKRSAVTRMVGRAGVPRILEEVSKCDIVCANCHRLRTFQRRSTGSVRE